MELIAATRVVKAQMAANIARDLGIVPERVNFSAFWLGISIMGLMAIGFGISLLIPAALMLAPAVFAFGLVAVGFLAMGPVTIAVDSYGPVTDNAQSIYELSVIETLPGITAEIERDHGFTPQWATAKRLLEKIEGRARTLGITRLFVLTTRTAHWFLERGFHAAELSELPEKRRELYNFQRNSLVFIKALDS